MTIILEIFFHTKVSYFIWHGESYLAMHNDCLMKMNYRLSMIVI